MVLTTIQRTGKTLKENIRRAVFSFYSIIRIFWTLFHLFQSSIIRALGTRTRQIKDIFSGRLSYNYSITSAKGATKELILKHHEEDTCETYGEVINKDKYGDRDARYYRREEYDDIRPESVAMQNSPS